MIDRIDVIRPETSSSGVQEKTTLSKQEETALHVSNTHRSAAGDQRSPRRDLKKLIGRRFGQYHIESVLGRGSMACVYKAKHLGLHRACALKVMDSALVA